MDAKTRTMWPYSTTGFQFFLYWYLFLLLYPSTTHRRSPKKEQEITLHSSKQVPIRTVDDMCWVRRDTAQRTWRNSARSKPRIRRVKLARRPSKRNSNAYSCLLVYVKITGLCSSIIAGLRGFEENLVMTMISCFCDARLLKDARIYPGFTYKQSVVFIPTQKQNYSGPI